MAELHGGRRDRLVVSPNLWAGVGLVRGGAGTALVGSPEQVAERMREYQAIGIDTIIGSGYPHLEEAYRVAELLFPRSASARREPARPNGTIARVRRTSADGTSGGRVTVLAGRLHRTHYELPTRASRARIGCLRHG